MFNVSLPCPTCRTPLILDADNAGQEALCPGCQTRLRLPTKVKKDAVPEILSPPPPSGSPMESNSPPTPPSPESAPVPGTPAKTALPQGRSKTAEQERQRLMAAAAAAGAAHTFRPDEAVLPADHHRTPLPTRRAADAPETSPVPSPSPAPSPSPSTAPTPPAGSTQTTGPAVTLPSRRTQAPTPADAAGELKGKLPSRPLTPIEPKPDIELGSSMPTGPSRFVRPAGSDAVPGKPPAKPLRTTGSVPAPASGPDSKASASETEAGPTSSDTDPEGKIPKRGFRLGLQRNLHFSPVPAMDAEKDTAAWGAQAETEKDAARGRRFVTLALLCFLLVAGGSGIYIFRHAFQASPPSPSAELADEIHSASLRSAEDVMKNVEDAKRVLAAFLAADSVEKLAAFVRHPDITRPRMERHYGSGPVKPRKVRSESQSWSELRIADTEFIRGSMELDDFRVYTITLELIPGADPKIDWESFVNWAEIPWKDFLKSPPDQAVEYRVTATTDPKDQYYNYSFKGRELDLMCFKLEDPEKYGSCWAYCDKDSEVASKLLFNLRAARRQGTVNEEGKTAVSCILKLRFPPEGKKTNQVMIESFVLDSWVIP